MKTINVGRKSSGGICGGLFGNPVHETKVSEQYRAHIQQVIIDNPLRSAWLKKQIKEGARLWCPGCGYGSLTCHARIIEQELGLT